jgi:hypothetical protein
MTRAQMFSAVSRYPRRRRWRWYDMAAWLGAGALGAFLIMLVLR